MYILTILAIIVSTILMLITSRGGIGNFINFIDVFSLLILLVISIPILISSNLFSDFNNAFKIAFGKKQPENLIKIRRAIEAVELMRKTLLYGSGFIFIATCIIMLHSLDDPALLGPNVAVILLTCLYGIIANILLLPIESKVKVKLIEFMQE